MLETGLNFGRLKPVKEWISSRLGKPPEELAALEFRRLFHETSNGIGEKQGIFIGDFAGVKFLSKPELADFSDELSTSAKVSPIKAVLAGVTVRDAGGEKASELDFVEMERDEVAIKGSPGQDAISDNLRALAESAAERQGVKVYTRVYQHAENSEGGKRYFQAIFYLAEAESEFKSPP